MPQEIVFYHSNMVGAPEPTNVSSSGSVTRILDACLVDGFNGIQLVSLTQSGGTASATTQASHRFSIGDWIEILGASPAGYVGRFKVLSVPDGTSFTFAVDSGLASPAAGAITARHPPAGWNRTVAGANINAYQSGAGSLGLWLQVEDNNPAADGSVQFRTRMVRDWTALDVGLVVQPQIMQIKYAGGWLLIADHKTCYLFMGALNTVGFFSLCFGEIDSYLAGDQYKFMCNGGSLPSSLNAYDSVGGYAGFATTAGRYFPSVAHYITIASDATGTGRMMRAISQVGPMAPCDVVHMDAYRKTNATNSWESNYTHAAAPLAADGSVPTYPAILAEWSAATSLTYRGKLRGLQKCMALLPPGSFNANGHCMLDEVLLDGELARMIVFRWLPWSREAQFAFKIDGSWG